MYVNLERSGREPVITNPEYSATEENKIGGSSEWSEKSERQEKKVIPKRMRYKPKSEYLTEALPHQLTEGNPAYHH